jgi:hypothetical protein
VWVARAAAYRAGASPEPDAELVAALEEGIAPGIAGLCLLSEAAILLRRGDRAAAGTAARAAARLAGRTNAGGVEAVALGVVASAEGTLDEAAFERFVTQVALVAIDAVRCQALALVLQPAPSVAARIPAHLLQSVRLRPPAERSEIRCEVLSEKEWSEILEGVPGVSRAGGNHGPG